MAIPTITQGVSPSIVDLVGDTPLIRLRRIERDFPGVELYAKAEWKNPGGSVKDRPALRIPLRWSLPRSFVPLRLYRRLQFLCQDHYRGDY